MAEDVPEQEEQHAGGDGVEHALDRLGDASNPPDRETDEDGGAGDRAQRGGRGVAHDSILLVGAKLRIS